MYQIIVDVRETLVLSKLETYQQTVSQSYPIVSRALDIGDICITDANGSPCVLIERKTIADLCASIKDGRYAEQSFRLNASSIPNHNIIYLIEGTPSASSKYVNDMMYGSMVSLLYFKGFSVLRTYNCDETVKMIYAFANKLAKEHTSRQPYYSTPTVKQDGDQEKGEAKEEETSTTDPLQYASVVKSSKKSNITIENIGVIMLSQIPAVSTTIATAILSHYSSIRELIQALTENKECLKDMTYMNSKGKATRISKTSIQNIIRFLIES